MLGSVRSFHARRMLVGLLVAALTAMAVACGGDKKQDAAAPPQVFDQTALPAASATPEAAQTPAAPEFPSPHDDAQLMRLVIPAAKVNAPLQVKGVNARNEMENPDGKDNVAWYNFTGRPGFGSNAVFSGHVDWFTGEQGVFWFLRDLKAGDEIMLKLSDGMELQYRVTSTDTYSAASAPVEEILGPTTKETVTLITCDGVFNRGSQDYDKRRVVRAERFA